MHPYANFSVTHNRQDLETAQMPTNRWVDKKAMVQLYNGILLGLKKAWNLIICNSMDEPGEYYAEWNKSETNTYDFTSVWNLINKINKQNRNRLIDTENRRTAVRAEGFGGCMKKVKCLSKNQKKTKTKTIKLIDVDNSMLITRKKGE